MLRMATSSITAGPANLPISSGQYAALFLRVSGTNAGGATLTAANLGQITGRIGGRPFLAVTFADLQLINNLDAGFVESASAIGAAFTFSCVIQASRAHDGNVFDIMPKDNSDITIDFSGVAGVAASGTVELYGVPAEGAQRYIPQMFTYTPTIVASGTDVRNIPLENITHLYFTTLTNFQSLDVARDGHSYVQASYAALQAFSNIDTQVEATLATIFVVNMNRTGALSEALSDDVKLTLQATAGGALSPHIIAVALDFTPEKMVSSANAVANAADAKFQRKAQDGKSRPVTVAKLLSGAPVSSVS